MSQQLEIRQVQTNDTSELILSGRLDAYWAEQLSIRIEEEIRAGRYRIVLDLKEVNYISSIGIRLFIRFFQELKKIDGQLGISGASEEVTRVLEMAGLQTLFGQKQVVPSEDNKPEIHEVLTPIARYTLYPDPRPTDLVGELLGKPDLPAKPIEERPGTYAVDFQSGVYGLGLGALGGPEDPCEDRLGELIGLGDAVAYFPTDGSNRPDFLLKTGSLQPKVQFRYGLLYRGNFSRVIRFEALDKPLKLSTLMEDLGTMTGWDRFALVMNAETAGLIGSALRTSPARINDPFEFPKVREHFYFTAEPEYANMMVLCTGVASREHDPQLEPFLRPLSPDTAYQGHFHAAVFSYLAQRKDQTRLSDTIEHIFSNAQLLKVMHLVNDHREATGLGESEFKQGLCWIGRLVTHL